MVYYEKNMFAIFVLRLNKVQNKTILVYKPLTTPVFFYLTVLNFPDVIRPIHSYFGEIIIGTLKCYLEQKNNFDKFLHQFLFFSPQNRNTHMATPTHFNGIVCDKTIESA